MLWQLQGSRLQGLGFRVKVQGSVEAYRCLGLRVVV